MNEDRPILVCGCPRSGTTLMQLMLHAHPRIAIPPETRFSLLAYDRWRHVGDLTDPAARRALAEWLTGGHNFRDLGLDRAATIEEIVAAPPTIGSAVGTIYRAYSRRFGKPRWGDKRPAYLLNMDAILHLFPNAQIITMIRDGRDCVASMKEADWYRGSLDHSISQWVRGMAAANRAARKLGPGQYCEVRYEDLVADPEPQLRRICAFLGEEYAPQMCEPARIAAVAVPERKVWHELTHGDVTDKRVGSWRERLTPEEIGLCEAIMGGALRERGYEVDGSQPVSAVRRLRYLKRTGRKMRQRMGRQVTMKMHNVITPGYLADRPAATVPAQPAEQRSNAPRR